MGKRLFLIGGLVGIVKNSEFFVTGPGAVQSRTGKGPSCHRP